MGRWGDDGGNVNSKIFIESTEMCTKNTVSAA
jgi:hypothetical protein